MAVQLTKKFRVDLAASVANSISAVKKVRASESARMEAEFQKAVANGMSYDDQVAFREEQLKKEKESQFFDPEYVSSIETSIAQTKKLARYERIRNKYTESLNEYATGKSSIQSHIDVLQKTMDTEQDPGIRAELQALISSALKEQSTNSINAIKNRAVVAQNDKSLPLLEASINEVQSKRAKASISENEEEVAMWDDTLIALNNSKSRLQIENGLNEIVFRTNHEALKSNDKLGILNTYIAGSDASRQVVYGGVTYPSMKAFWENKRGEYIQGAYLDDVQKEINAVTATIAASSKFGQIPVERIQAVNDFFNNLKARPEFTPYVERIEQSRVGMLNSMVSDLQGALADEAAAIGTEAAQLKQDQAFLDIEQRFGIKLARPPTSKEIAADKTLTAAVTEAATTGTPLAPKETTTTASTPTAQAAPAVPGTRVAQAGDNLSRIATDAGVSLNTLLDLNPEYKANPNALKIGAVIKLPTATPTQTAAAPVTAPAPAATPAPVVAPTNNQAQPAAQPIQPTMQTASTPPANQPVVNKTPKVVVVQPGDTLSSVAQRELGSASRWKEITNDAGEGYDETTAKTLKIGTKLNIPGL